MFANGFSGHGLQQSPAVGRGVSELIIHGAYQTLDLSQLSYERIARNEPFHEDAVI
jgi:glycine/D-amino acid oxidase-like deaminating enzyme